MFETSLVAIPESLQNKAEELLSSEMMTAISSINTQVEEYKNKVTNMVVGDESSAILMTDTVKPLKKLRLKLDSRRKESTESLRDDINAINGFYNSFIEAINAIEADGEKALNIYLKAKRKREQEEAEAAAKAESDRLKKEADEALAVATDAESYPDEGMRDLAMSDAVQKEAIADKVSSEPLPERPKTRITGGSGKSGLTKRYSAEVINMAIIPTAILNTPNVKSEITKAISAIARTQRDAFDVPGAKLIVVENTSIR